MQGQIGFLKGFFDDHPRHPAFPSQPRRKGQGRTGPELGTFSRDIGDTSTSVARDDCPVNGEKGRKPNSSVPRYCFAKRCSTIWRSN